MKQTQKTRRAMLKGGVAASGLLALGIGDALAQQGPGVTDKEIKLGS